MADEEAPAPKGSKRDKAALPFAEDDEALDGRAWTRKPLLVLGAVIAVVIVVVLLVLAFNDLSGGDDDGNDGGDVPPIATTTTTTSPSTTTTSTPSTTAPPATTTTAVPLEGCSPEEGDPDCIDPDGDGIFQIIVGGGDCLTTAEDPLDCRDTDGDGEAGPPAILD
jgi:hypothetical protein